MPVAWGFEDASSPLPETSGEFDREVKEALGFSIVRICCSSSLLSMLIPLCGAERSDVCQQSHVAQHLPRTATSTPPHPLLLIHVHINRNTQSTTTKTKATTLEMPPSGKAPAYGPRSYSPPQYLLASTGLSHDELVSQYQGGHMRLFPHHL